MAREIKFRAWIDGKPVTVFPGRSVHAGMFDLTGTEVIEQFTGTRDTNGKDIYEGDICLVPGWAGSKSEVIVEWKAVRGSDDMGTDMIGFPDHCGATVIGNIHERKKASEGK